MLLQNVTRVLDTI